MTKIQLQIIRIRLAITIFLISSILMAVFAALSVIVSIMGLAAQYATTDQITVGAVIGVTIFSILSTSLPTLGVLIGLYQYWRGVLRIRPHFDRRGRRGISCVAIGTLLFMLSILFYLLVIFLPASKTIYLLAIPTLSILLQLIGFIALSGSNTLNEKGRRGARQLYVATLCFFLSPLCLVVPVIGGAAWLFLSVAYFWLLYRGWGKVSSSFSRRAIKEREEAIEDEQNA